MNMYEREKRAYKYLAQKKYERECKADENWEAIIVSGAVLFTVMLMYKTGSVLL